ncbi:MAG: HAD family phosphatase [Acidobacteriota bacterium]|nr:MAG: HAD family phosphatase [Acidobacteriota bacterium]
MTRSSSHDTRLICFDVDGTLVEHVAHKTIWQLVNQRVYGDDALNKRRFQAFRDGRLTYPEWVALDVLDWKSLGVSRAQIEDVIRTELTLVAGALETVATLKQRGYPIAIVSGTIDLILELLLGEFPLDRAFTNKIHFDESGRIAGWEATPFDVDGKADAVRQLAAEQGITTEEVAFVGDSWNDRAAFRTVGFSVAFRPKDDQLRKLAHVVIENGSLLPALDHFPGLQR